MFQFHKLYYNQYNVLDCDKFELFFVCPVRLCIPNPNKTYLLVITLPFKTAYSTSDENDFIKHSVVAVRGWFIDCNKWS